MLQKVKLVLGLLAVVMGTIFSYVLLHEGGHALAVIWFGGKLTVFELNFLTSSPHISYTHNFSAIQRAIVAISGPLLPYVIFLIIVPLIKKITSPLWQVGLLAFSIGGMNSLLPAIVLPILFLVGKIGAGEDIGNFIYFSNLHPLLVSSFFLILFLFSLWYLVRIGQVVSLIGQWRKKTIVEWSSFGKFASSFLVLMLLLMVTLMLFSNIPRQTQLSLSSYASTVQTRFKDFEQDHNILYTLEIKEPTILDVGYSLNALSPAHLELINVSGTGFLHQKGNATTMYQGVGKLSNAIFSGFVLEEGHYQIQINTADRKGHINLGINTRSPVPEEFQYAEILQQVNSGVFGLDSYAEDGYLLVFNEHLVGDEKQIAYTLPKLAPFLQVSAFFVGQYEENSLIYQEGGRAVPILKNVDATIGFGIESKSKGGQLNLVVTEADVEVFIYVKLENSL